MPTRIEGQRSYLIPVGLSLLCTAIVYTVIAMANGLFVVWENKTIDYRFQIRGTLPTDSRVVLIDIDDESIAAIGRWPWDRTYHARMIEILSKSGAAVIGYDILFNQPVGPEEDVVLVAAAREAGNVYLPIGFEFEEERGNSLLTVKRAVGPFADLQSAAAGVGHISSNRDSDGTIRRVPLAVEFDGHPMFAFSLAMLSGYFHVPMGKILIDPEKEVRIDNVVQPGAEGRSTIEIPVSNRGMMVVNYAGRWEDTFDHYPFHEVLSAWDTEDGRENLRKTLTGKICLVSNTATGYDLKPVPLEAAYAGGGIHANALNTVLTGQYLRNLSASLMMATTFLLSCLVVGLTIRTRWWGGLIATGLVGMMSILITYVAFLEGIVVQAISPLFAIALAYTSGTVYQSRRAAKHVAEEVEEREKIGQKLQQVSDALHTMEADLRGTRQERSDLMRQMRELQDGRSDDVERMQDLESSLKRANSRRDELLEEKRALEIRLAGSVLEQANDKPSMGGEYDALQRECANAGIMTQHRGVLDVFKLLTKAARAVAPPPVLIQGESGTGKELLARAVHQLGRRAQRPFLTINCTVLQDSLFESDLFGHKKGAFTGAVSDKEGRIRLADGGTVFLDEIGELRPELQQKLLRVIQTGEVEPVGATSPVVVDVRIIAATNKDLETMVAAGTFRDDLFYRLKGYRVTVPPLRQRPGDIELLSRFFLEKFARQEGRDLQGFTVTAMNCLKTHPWKGNIRELENLIHSAVTLAEGNSISASDLGFRSARPAGLSTEGARESVESSQSMVQQVGVSGEGDRGGGDDNWYGKHSEEEFLDVLKKHQFNLIKAGKEIGMERDSVRLWLKGILFRRLAECDRVPEDDEGLRSVVVKMSGEGELLPHAMKVLGRYYFNLKQKVEGCDGIDRAIKTCVMSNKNMPQRYHDGMRILVRKCFDQRTSIKR